MKFIAIAIIAGLLALAGLPHGAQAADDVFSGKHKDAIHKIIKQYLLAHPEVMDEIVAGWQRYQNTKREKQARERMVEMRKAIVAYRQEIFHSKFDFSNGNPKGNVTMVEFFDYNCGFCKRALPDVLSLLKNDKQLKLVYKELPILGPGSLFAARAAIAAKKQGKYWKFHLALMRSRGANEPLVLSIAKQVGLDVEKLKKDMEAPEIRAEIDTNLQLAQKIGVNGTPAFIIGNRAVPGALGLAGLKAQIAGVRKEGGCKIC
jgi:protein-disulfide isomerase